MFEKRFADLAWFIESINSVGTPVIIASDKRPADKLSKKLASIYNAVLFEPKENISIRIKKKIGIGTRSPHERDALTAAKMAYNEYANKLRQAEKKAEKENADVDKVKTLVIRKYSIDEAIKDIGTNKRFARK